MVTGILGQLASLWSIFLWLIEIRSMKKLVSRRAEERAPLIFHDSFLGWEKHRILVLISGISQKILRAKVLSDRIRLNYYMFGSSSFYLQGPSHVGIE